MKAYKAFTLSGDSVSEGIYLEDDKLTRYDGYRERLLAVGLDPELSEYHLVKVGKDVDGTILLAPVEEEPDTDRVLVLVHEYTPGSGAKRWPSFYIDWDNAGEVEILAQVSRGRGSGSDTYSLVLAPMGWPENIAGQFIDERDYGGQMIAYRPNFNPRERDLELELEGFRRDLEELGYFLGLAQGGDSNYVELSFTQGEHPKTGELQWEYTTREDGKTVKYVVDRWGTQPGSEKESWVCRKGRVLVDKPNFQLILVELETRSDERDELTAEIQRVEAELANLRSG